MRIITGSARGVRLTSPEGEHTRPTSERAKEALFSSLGYKINGARVLDLFAGSGQLGLEAASRGADFAVLVDNDNEAVRIIRSNAAKCRLDGKCAVLRADFLSCLTHSKDKFDIVFLDPPYATDLIDRAVSKLLDNDLLSTDAIIVCESDREDVLCEANEARLENVRVMKHGIARIRIMRVKETEK